MIVTKERQRKFKTPLGGALVWGLVDSVTHGVAGWHFILQNGKGIESYFSNDGRAYSNAVVRSENLVIGAAETDNEKARLLRRLWEEYILRLDLLPIGSTNVIAIG
jgi:hypothetical protein